MNKVLAFIMVLLPLAVCAQVRIAEPAPKMLEDFPYDSTTNYVKKEQIRCLVGQELQVLPLREYDQREGYRYIVKGKKEFPCFFTKIGYDDLLDKIFKCTDAFSREKNGLCDYYLELKDNSNGELYCYKFSEARNDFYFLVLGYKEKFERDCRGKTFLFKGAALRFYDFNTGEKVVAEPKQQYVFQEMIFNSKDNELGFLFTDGQSHLLCFDEFQIKHSLVEKSIIDRYISLYGQSSVNGALEGVIWAGMPVELLLLSRGKPDKKNRASHGEQWVYGKYATTCVYIEDGKVTAWN